MQRVAYSYFETRGDAERLDHYFDHAVPTIAEIRRVCAPLLRGRTQSAAHQDILARETNDEVATSLLAQMVELATQQSNPDR